MAEQNSVILHRIWRNLYEPTLDVLFREYESEGVLLTPDVAIREMEQVFKFVFLSVESERTFTSQKDSTSSRRLYFRFDGLAFRREARRYAVDLFRNSSFSRNRVGLLATTKMADGKHRFSASQRGTGAPSRPLMASEALLKHGEPLLTEKIAEAIKNRLNVILKRPDIARDTR